MTKPKTKKMVIYHDEETGSLMLRATRRTTDPKGYITINEEEKRGLAVSDNIEDKELGEKVRKVLAMCE